MLGKHSSVETTVYSAQQLLFGTSLALGYSYYSSVLPLCTNCFFWQMKKNNHATRQEFQLYFFVLSTLGYVETQAVLCTRYLQ